MKLRWMIAFLAAAFTFFGGAAAQAPATQQSAPPETPTKQAKPNKTDRGLTSKVRRAIASDKTLSSSGKNLQITTLNGTVTLRGTVRTNEEKTAIIAKAAQIAGPDNVKDEMRVTAPTK